MADWTDDAIFGTAILPVLQHEGGFTDDADDNGNWSGGAKGLGVRAGTKFGISAAQYPRLDIAALTVDDAKAIYYPDYWRRFRIDELPGILIPTKVLDTVVLCGAWGVIVLQRALAGLGGAVAADGAIGPETAKACSAVPTEALLTQYRATLVAHFDAIVAAHPFQQKFLRGWDARAAT